MEKPSLKYFTVHTAWLPDTELVSTHSSFKLLSTEPPPSLGGGEGGGGGGASSPSTPGNGTRKMDKLI